MPGENQLQNLLHFRNRLPGRQTTILAEIRGSNDETDKSLNSNFPEFHVQRLYRCSTSGDGNSRLPRRHYFQLESLVMNQQPEIVVYYIHWL